MFNVQLLFVAEYVLDSCPVDFRNPDAVLGDAFSDQDKEIVEKKESVLSALVYRRKTGRKTEKRKRTSTEAGQVSCVPGCVYVM